MSVNSPLLQVRDLRIAFDGLEAVHGVSFELRAGEVLGLVGESGSGKSAVSLALMRLLPPGTTVTGEIEFAGVSLPGLDPEAMRRVRGREIGMIFQEPMTALNPVMPVGSQIAEALEAHAGRTWWGASRLPRGEVRERVLAAMRDVSLPGPEGRYGDYPHQFSGGQRQRLMIAMATVNRPRLLIADEPTTALDVTVQAQVLDLLRRLRGELGLAMLFISHDLAVVGEIADRVAVMQGGCIVESGAAHDVLTAPQHPYTQALLRAVPTMRTPRDQPLAR